MQESGYKDKVILALREKYAQKQAEARDIGTSILIGTRNEPLHREWLFQGKFSMLLPGSLTDMGETEAAAKYQTINRPQVIKAQEHGDAVFTLSSLAASENHVGQTYIRDTMIRLREDMMKLWKQNVFYDMGIAQAGELEIPWMDMKGFCLNGSFYSFVFLFKTGGDLVLGNFHCNFQHYDIWKPAMLKLLTTIEG